MEYWNFFVFNLFRLHKSSNDDEQISDKLAVDESK